MKEVLILRHSERGKDGKLTQKGVDACLELAKQLGRFDIVIASPTERTKQTAFLLSGVEPRIEMNAGLFKPTPEQQKLIEIAEDMNANAIEIVQAIWQIPGLVPVLKESGEALLTLAKNTIDTLGENGRALIVSHNIMMLAMEKLIKDANFDFVDHTVDKLEGFAIDDNFTMRTTNLKQE